MELKCPKCGFSFSQGDLFCRKCGTRVDSSSGVGDQVSPFQAEATALLKTLREFRGWIDQSRKKNVRFMRAYREKIEREIDPRIREFREKYANREEGESPLFHLIVEAFSVLSRPITFMETGLRPSVGMGVFLERWMMRSAVESYLKECCQEVDHHLEELTKKIGVRSQESE